MNEIKPRNPKYIVKVMRGYRLKLPEDYLNENNISEGDFMVFQEVPNSKNLMIIPVEVVPKHIVVKEEQKND